MKDGTGAPHIPESVAAGPSLEKRASGFSAAVKTTPVVRKFRDEATGRMQINNYLVGKLLSSGQLSSVRQYDEIDPTTGALSGQYACKRYRKGVLARKKQFRKDSVTGRMVIFTKLEDVQNELWVLSQLKHPNCLRLHEVLESGRPGEGDDGKLYIITNFQACGEVMSLKHNFFPPDFASDSLTGHDCTEDPSGDEDQQNAYTESNADRDVFLPTLKGTSTISEAVCRCVIRDAANGLRYMHEELNIAHRDVKPSNLLMAATGTVQLGDMGTAERMDLHGRSKHTKGTYMFMAPECMQTSASLDEPYVGHDGRAADVWALGITLYVMLFGKTPYKAGCSYEQFFGELAGGHIALPDVSPLFSKEAKEVLLLLLQKDVQQRITTEQLLSLPWVKDADSNSAREYAAQILKQKEEEIKQHNSDSRSASLLDAAACSSL